MSSFTLSGSKCEREATKFDVSESNIRKILCNLDINKAKGPDGLPPLLFKQTESTIAKSISELFTSCKRLGVFPTSWKVGRMSPIHKKGNKTAVENYRPVTIFGYNIESFRETFVRCYLPACRTTPNKCTIWLPKVKKRCTSNAKCPRRYLQEYESKK